MYVCAPHVCLVPREVRRVAESLGAGVIDGCCECWDPNPGPRREQPVLNCWSSHSSPFSLSFDKWGHKVTQEMPWMEFPSEKVESGTTRGTPWFSTHSFLGNKVSSWILGKCGFTAGEGGRPWAVLTCDEIRASQMQSWDCFPFSWPLQFSLLSVECLPLVLRNGFIVDCKGILQRHCFVTVNLFKI